jgi:hypothetical protein
VPWLELPGYLIIIRAFLIEIKIRDIKTYPEALKQAAVSILHNEKLLNIIVVLIFKKTNALDVLNVVKTMELLNLFL